MTPRPRASRPILFSAATIGAATMLASLAVFIRDLVIAAKLGRGDELEAYLIALLLPAFLVSVLTTTLGSAYIPAYIHARTHGNAARGNDLLRMVIGAAAIALAIAAAVLAVAFDPLLPVIASNFPAAKRAHAADLFWVLLPVLFFTGMANVIGEALNAERRFAWAAAAPALPPIFAAIALLLLWDRLGVFALAAGTVLGAFAQLVLVASGAARASLPVAPKIPRWSDAELGRVREQYLPLAFGAVLMSGTMIIDQAMAASLDPGSVAAWSYGTRVVGLVVGVGSLALNTAILPHFSAMAARAQWTGIRAIARKHALQVFVASIPLVIVLLLWSEPIVALIFQRGRFTAVDTAVVANVQALFAMQIPFYIVGVMYARVISSLGRNHILFWGNGITLSLKVILNLLLIPILGVAGIALATSMVIFASCVFLWIMARREIASRMATR